MESYFNPFTGGFTSNFGWNEPFTPYWDFESSKPKSYKNKFNLGDEVYTILNHKVVNFKITSIKLIDGKVLYRGSETFVFIDSERDGVEEKYIFKSKKELIKSL